MMQNAYKPLLTIKHNLQVTHTEREREYTFININQHCNYESVWKMANLFF